MHIEKLVAALSAGVAAREAVNVYCTSVRDVEARVRKDPNHLMFQQAARAVITFNRALGSVDASGALLAESEMCSGDQIAQWKALKISPSSCGVKLSVLSDPLGQMCKHWAATISESLQECNKVSERQEFGGAKDWKKELEPDTSLPTVMSAAAESLGKMDGKALGDKISAFDKVGPQALLYSIV